MTVNTGFVWHERYMWHDNGSAAGLQPMRGLLQPGLHLESPETKRRLKNLLDAYEVTPQLRALPVAPAERDLLERFHTPDYLDRVQALSDGDGGDAGDAALVGPGSAEIAKLAVGGTQAAVAAVARADVTNAYALTRPPGHHAERDRGRGFCVFNNIGLAIMAARAQGLVDRVAVVDWDVHHGNGTQQAFYDNPDVLTVSLHQEMLYPVNQGFMDEIGAGPGEGANLNVPLHAGCGGGAYLAAIDEIVVPALEAFRPELIVIACGFDACYFDPLSHMLLVANHYRVMTQKLMAAADELCGGRVVVNHEGGYCDFYVPLCGVAVIETLAGITSGVKDPYGGTEFVANQDLLPQQRERLDAVRAGPLARVLARA
ncbi:MAG: class II histone deacetylase [Pseudomonadota bacterium]